MASEGMMLNAATAYSNIQNQPKMQADPTTVKGATNFQDVVKVQFNNFAKMSPEQILTHIKSAQGQLITNSSAGISAATNSNVTSSVLKKVRKSLNEQEKTVRKSLVNEASLVDILTATTEATNNLKVLVDVRNKFLEVHEKVMNMSV